MTTINGITDQDAAEAATKARRAWEETQAELQTAHWFSEVTERALWKIGLPATAAATTSALFSPVSGKPLLATDEQVKETPGRGKSTTDK